MSEVYQSKTIENDVVDKQYQYRHPYNINPEYLSPSQKNENLMLKVNPPAFESLNLIFRDDMISSVRGYEHKDILNLKNIFIPIKNYSFSQVNLAPDNENTRTATFDFSGNDLCNFLCIMPSYDFYSLNTENYKLQFKFDEEENFKLLQSIYICALAEKSIKKLYLRNPTQTTISVDIVFGF